MLNYGLYYIDSYIIRRRRAWHGAQSDLQTIIQRGICFRSDPFFSIVQYLEGSNIITYDIK